MAPITPGDLVEVLLAQDTVEGWIAFLDPEAEYQPRPGGPVYRGLAEIRRWAEQEIADPRRPEPLPVSLIEMSDKAVVRGHLRFPRGTEEKPHHVLELAAWVVTVADGRLRRVEAFSSWSAAEQAAGLASGPGTAGRRLGPGLQMLHGLLRRRRLALG